MAALQRENMLHDALEKQKQEANKLNESAIEYSLLKRDLDTNRQLYEGSAGKVEGSRRFGGPAFQQFPHRRRCTSPDGSDRAEHPAQSCLSLSCWD